MRKTEISKKQVNFN